MLSVFTYRLTVFEGFAQIALLFLGILNRNETVVELKNCSGGFDDSLSKLSQLWHPRAKERETMEEPSDLAELFSQLGLGKYTDLFQQQEVSASLVLVNIVAIQSG